MPWLISSMRPRLLDDDAPSLAVGARYRARPVAACVWPRRSARSRRRSRWPRCRRRLRLAALQAAAGTARHCPRRCNALPMRLCRCRCEARKVLKSALADDLPHLKRDGGFIRAGYQRRSRCGAPPARRQPRGHGRARSPIRRGHRHQVAEGPPQQHPRLFHRGDAAQRQADAVAALERHVPPSPDDGQRRALHNPRTGRDRRPDRVGQRARAQSRTGDFRRARAAHCRCREGRSARSRRRWPNSTSMRGSRRWPANRTMCAPRSTRPKPSTFAADATRSSSSRSQGRRPAPSSRTTAAWGRGEAAPPPGFDEMPEARIWLVTGPEHGRQIDVSAPECA